MMRITEMRNNNNNISLEEQKRAENVSYIVRFILVFLITLVGMIVKFIQSPTSLSEVNYVEGRYLKMNSYYKKITLEVKNEKNGLFRKESFEFSQNTFDKMSNLLNIDTNEHFVQLWFIEEKYIEYYQVSVDGTLIKTFNLWNHQKTPVILIGITIVILIVLFIFYFKNKRKTVTFSENNIPVE